MPTYTKHPKPRQVYIPRRNSGWRHIKPNPDLATHDHFKKVDSTDHIDNANPSLQSNLRTDEIPIPCVYFPNHTKNSKLMIYFHGIGEDMGRIVNEPHLIRKHAGFNVLCVEYPGYGINFYKGLCTERQMIRDSYSVLDFVLSATQLKMKDLVVFGRSIGTGVAANLAW